MGKFDVVVGNPPFQKSGSDQGGSVNLWSAFIRLSFKKLLKENGHLMFITPTSWMSFGKYTPNVFKEKQFVYLNLDIKKFFNVGSTMCYYHLINNNKKVKTLCKSNGEEFYFNINDYALLPSDFNEKTLSILDKVFNTDDPKLNISWAADGVSTGGFGSQAEHISKEKTGKFNQELLHTNAIRVFTDLPIPNANKPKIIFSISGTFKPFYDTRLGVTQASFYYLVKNKIEGENMLSYFNSKLYRLIINKLCKYSGFIIQKVFSNLPKLSHNKKWTNKELYKYFNLTQEEIDYIESQVK